MDLEIGGRWHHPVNVFHGRDRPAGAPATEAAHSGRMSAELGIARAVSGLIATAWLGIAAHQLTVYQFGQVTLVLSLGALVSIGTDLGIPLALSKVACDHAELDHDAVWRAVLTRVVAGLIAGIVLVALWANTGETERWWLAGLYSISVIVTPVGGSFLALLRGRAIGIVEAVYDVAIQGRPARRGRGHAGGGLETVGRHRRLRSRRPRLFASPTGRRRPPPDAGQDTRSASAGRAATARHSPAQRRRHPRHAPTSGSTSGCSLCSREAPR